MIIKAITIRQPWANLIVYGITGGYRDKGCRFCQKLDCSDCKNEIERRRIYKTVEIRTWQTKHRGSLAIHAGKTIDKQCLCQLGECKISIKPLGSIIAMANLYNIFTYEGDKHFEDDMYRHGVMRKPKAKNIFEWEFANIEPLKKPIPCRGRQGLFEVEI